MTSTSGSAADPDKMSVTGLDLLARRALSYTRIDGIFGPVTRTVAGQFQRDSGLAPDGIVGPATLAACAGDGVRLPTLLQGSHGSVAEGKCSPVCTVPPPGPEAGIFGTRMSARHLKASSAHFPGGLPCPI
jgi:hypothetical protein